MKQKNINKDAAAIVFLTSLVIFVLVPIIIKLLSLDVAIYKNQIEGGVILQNGFVLVFMYVIMRINNATADSKITNVRSKASLYTFLVSMITFGWIVFYVIYGGLSYRESDVEFGYGSRVFILKICFAFLNFLMILVVGVWCTRYKKIAAILILLLAVVLLISGSRGYLVSLVLTLVMARAMEKEESIFSIRSIMVFGMIIPIIAIWGYIRDGGGQLYVSFLHRLSEPYWYFMYEKHYNMPELIYFTFERIKYIFIRMLGHNVDYSIDGSNYLIERYLGIAFKEGVSLPITFIGEGYLYNYYYGPFVAALISAVFIRYYVQFVSRFSTKIYHLDIAIKSFFISKLFFLYSKSVSGIFLYLFYEGFRDLVLLAAFYIFYRIFKNETAR